MEQSKFWPNNPHQLIFRKLEGERRWGEFTAHPAMPPANVLRTKKLVDLSFCCLNLAVGGALLDRALTSWLPHGGAEGVCSCCDGVIQPEKYCGEWGRGLLWSSSSSWWSHEEERGGEIKMMYFSRKWKLVRIGWRLPSEFCRTLNNRVAFRARPQTFASVSTHLQFHGRKVVLRLTLRLRGFRGIIFES